MQLSSELENLVNQVLETFERHPNLHSCVAFLPNTINSKKAQSSVPYKISYTGRSSQSQTA